MATPPSSPPNISELPPAPNSGTDTPAEFDTKANNTVAAQVSMIPQINSANDWVESTAQEVYGNALEAAQSATNASDSAANAEQSAQEAQNASDLLGDWSSLTGSVSIGQTVIHEAGRWQAKVNIADVTLSEPSLANTDWFLINYQSKSITVLDGETLTVNATNEIKTTQSNLIPLAASVPSGWILTITVAPEFRGLTSTHLVSGSDTTTDDRGNISDGFICEWPNGGVLNLVSNGLDNWRVLNA